VLQETTACSRQYCESRIADLKRHKARSQGGQASEIGDRKSEAGNQLLEVKATAHL
jgi:hypothetical protein